MIPKGVDVVMFRRSNGKIGVCANATMGGSVYWRKLDWKMIKVMAEFRCPGFTRINFNLKRKRYYQLLRQHAYLQEKASSVPYREAFYLPHFVDDDGLYYEARGSNFSLAGSFPDYQLDDDLPPPEEVTNLDDVSSGRCASLKKWFARIRDRMRR